MWRSACFWPDAAASFGAVICAPFDRASSARDRPFQQLEFYVVSYLVDVV
jgi:hypothetical protein